MGETRRHVCIVVSELGPSGGGPARVAVNLSNSLVQRSQEIGLTVLALSESEEGWACELDPAVKFEVLPGRCARRFKEGGLRKAEAFGRISSVILALVKYFRSRRVHDVICQSDMFYVMAAGAAAGIKVIVRDDFQPSDQYGMLGLGRRVAARLASQIVALTPQYREDLTTSLRPRCPVISIFNPMHFKGSQPAYRCDSRTILSAGHFNDYKGFDMLVEVAYTVLREHPAWSWVVCGDGPMRESLESEAKARGLTGRLIFPGRVASMGKYYQKAALFVLTSRTECLPTVLLEARWHRLPIVAFDVSAGVRVLAEDGINSILVQPFDIEKMAGAINALIPDDSRRRALSDRSGKGLDRFHPNVVADQWLDMIQSHEG